MNWKKKERKRKGKKKVFYREDIDLLSIFIMSDCKLFGVMRDYNNFEDI